MTEVTCKSGPQGAKNSPEHVFPRESVSKGEGCGQIYYLFEAWPWKLVQTNLWKLTVKCPAAAYFGSSCSFPFYIDWMIEK